MSSNQLWRSKKILELVYNNDNTYHRVVPESPSLLNEDNLLENFNVEFINNLPIVLASDEIHCTQSITAANIDVLGSDDCTLSVMTKENNDHSTLAVLYNDNGNMLTNETNNISKNSSIQVQTKDAAKDTIACSALNSDDIVMGTADVVITNDNCTVSTGSSSVHLLNQIEDPISDENEQEALVQLVPYDINSDSDSDCDENYPERSTKRKKRAQVKKSNWFAEKNRKLREAGKKYYGRKREQSWNYEIPRESRKIKARCKCKVTANGVLKCTNLTEEDRKDIFKTFWNMSWPEKQIYVDSLVISVPVKRQRGRKNAEESRRAQSLIYYLKLQEQRLRVCRTMFLHTLGIGRWTVLNWKNNVFRRCKEKHNEKNQEQPTTSKPFAKERQELFSFLDSLPVMESHYCRATTEKKYLLPEWTSKKGVYDFYVQNWCKQHNVKPLSITIFNEAFDTRNLGLYFPKKDQCERCVLYKVGKLTELDYIEHQTKKEEARAEKQKDKEKENIVFTVDLQAVLMAPKSKISSLYYRTKLQIHNLTFFNLKNKDGFCYIWNESEGGLNSEEFASIWMDLIENKVVLQEDSAEPMKVIFYSDGCTYQNRNSVLGNALLTTAMNKNIVIEQKFLEVGHTQMEADSMHSTIERALKNKDIHVPAEYISICRSARKKPRPYEVKYLNYQFFKKFNEVKFYKSIRPGRSKGDAKVTDIRALRYTPNGDIYYKLRFPDEWKILPQRKSSSVTPVPLTDLQNLYSNRPKISARKFEDLQYLKNTLPEDYRSYYDSLPHD